MDNLKDNLKDDLQTFFDQDGFAELINLSGMGVVAIVNSQEVKTSKMDGSINEVDLYLKRHDILPYIDKFTVGTRINITSLYESGEFIIDSYADQNQIIKFRIINYNCN